MRYSSQNENILLLSWSKWLVRQPTQTNFGGLVAAVVRGLLGAHGWVSGPRGRLYQLFTHCFLTLHQVSSLHQVSAKCTHAHDAGALNGF